MNTIDLHCDVLYKLEDDPELELDDDGGKLDVTLSRLIRGNVRLQCFAIFVSGDRTRLRFERILDQISAFHQRVLKHPHMMWVRSSSDLKQALRCGKTGAMLTLEGVDALHGDLSLFDHLYQLGVRMFGATWNGANWAADGVMEPRQGTWTNQGREWLRKCEQYRWMIDVSHLCEPAFWELLEIADLPVVASHSNAYSICPHPRNLNDRQICGMLKRKGLIGLTFVPYFLRDNGQADLNDVLHHLDHICALGGVRQVGFGSDFDGVDRWTKGLEHSGKFADLADVLLQYYSEDETKGFLGGNVERFLCKHLPSQTI